MLLRYNGSGLSCDLARPQGLSNFMGKSQLYGKGNSHHPARFGRHKHCGIGVLKAFVSLIMVYMEMGKKETIIISTVAKRKIYFIKNSDLLHWN